MFFEELHHLMRHSFRRGLPFPMWGASFGSSDPADAKKLLNETTSRRPGLKVMGLSSVMSVVEANQRVSPSRFCLAECYNYANTDTWLHSDGTVPFLPLSAFIVDLFMSCARGSTRAEIIRIAEGKPPELPTGPKEKDEAGTNVLAKHTLRITLESHLPEVEGIIHHQ